MEDSHRANVLVTSCLKTPVDPHTKAPLAQYERERALPYAARHPPDNRDYEKEKKVYLIILRQRCVLTEHDSESDRSDGEEGGGDRGVPPLTRDPGVPSGAHIDLRQFCSSNQEYYRRLEELKRAHLRTMAELEGMYRTKLGITSTAWPPVGVAEGNRRSKLEKNAETSVCKLRKAFSAVELTHGWGCSLSDSSEEGVADNDAAKEKSQLTSPKERIRTMWQDFTVGELTPRERPASRSSLGSEPEGRVGGKGRSKGRGVGGAGAEDGPERDTWRHRVTVPRPFRMTVREAERKRLGVKSRSEVELENALLRRELAELSECQRKFRASPVPAHVYLPLYEEIAARDQERRERRLSRQRRAGTSQEPFSFLERERRRKEEREAQLRSLPREEEEAAAARGFRAKPVPRRVYDSTVSERMQEDRLYRAIKMQMRAQELLHSSSLPRGMTAAAAARRSSRPREPAEEERTEADFRPRINGEVPDLDGSYRRFREQLRSRRDVRPTTACEPFRLRTAQTAARRHRAPARAVPTSPGGVARQLHLTPARPRTASSSLCSSLSGSLELLPARTTDAAKRRQEAVRRVLEQRTKAKEEEESWRRRQKQRERRLQRVVSRRARANDPHLALSQTCRAKLRQFRKQDLQRRKEYREEMREMQERVKERPLLLEQVTQRNAKRAAERRYTDALRGHGLSEDFVCGMAPEGKPRQRPRGAPDDRSSVASEEKPRGKGDAGAGLSAGAESVADDYPDDYEELDDRELSGEEKGQEEEEGDSNKDSEEEEEEEEDDEADQEVDENEQ